MITLQNINHRPQLVFDNDGLPFTIQLLLMILLGISQYNSIQAGNLVLTGLVGFMFVFVDLDTCFGLLLTALPFFNLFNFSMGMTSLYYLFVGVFLLKYALSGCLTKEKLVIFALLVIVRISSNDFAALLRWSLLMAVLVFSYHEDFYRRNLSLYIERMSTSFIWSLAIGYVMLLGKKSVYTNAYIYTDEGSTTRFAGLVGDSVFCAQFICVMVSALLAFALLEPYNARRNVLKSVIMSVFCLLTYSKTGLILLAAIFLAYAIISIRLNARDEATLYKAILGILGIVVIILIIVQYILSHLDDPMISNYVLRFTSGDLMTGRSVIFDHYVELLKSRTSSLFCAMPQALYLKKFSTGIISISRAHNVYLETVCAFGLLASLCIFAFIIGNIGDFFRHRPELREWFQIVPLLVLVLTGFVLHGNFEAHYYFQLGIALAVADMERSAYSEDEGYDEY